MDPGLFSLSELFTRAKLLAGLGMKCVISVRLNLATFDRRDGLRQWFAVTMFLLLGDP